jgi:hypothetical protein
MGKYILVFDDISRYNNNYNDTATGISQLFDSFNERKDFCLYIFKDIENEEKIKRILKQDNVDLNNDEFYIVLHHSAVDKGIGVSKEQCEELFPNSQIKIQMHEDGHFYYSKMPSLISNKSITFAEVADGFFTTDEEQALFNEYRKRDIIFHKLLEGTSLNDKEKDFIKFDENESILELRERLYN